MAGLWKQIVRDGSGQALPLVLALLALGGLVITPCLSYASTTLNAGRIVEENVRGGLAADAGVEDVLWCLENGVPNHTSLSETVNRMAVAMQVEEKGTYTLFAGEWVGARHHSDWLEVTGNMTEEAPGVYKYTITVTRQPETSGNITLAEVGARLPVDYNYQPGSAASFGDNLSIEKPDDTLDGAGAHLIEWEFPTPPPRPQLDEDNPTRTQIFYATGEGDLEGYYSWVVAQREDIDAVGEITGTVYIITATATDPGDGEITATVVADVMMSDGDISIVSWRINPQ